VDVAVYTTEPDLLRPALDSHPQVKTVYRKPAEYQKETGAQVVIFDRFVPKEMPSNAGVVWIDPPERGSPFRVRTRATNVRIERWEADHDLGSGLRSKDFRLPQTEIFASAAGDLPIAEVEGGPVIMARPQSRMLALGFHPGSNDTRFDVATPLLMANILRWFEPAVFRSWELHGGSIGSVTVSLDAGVKNEDIKVLGERGTPLPFTVQGRSLRFFAGVPGDIRVLTGGSERVHSLSLPEVGDKIWEPPKSARRGIPSGLAQAFSRDIWQILAVLGGVGLVLEWLLYGRKRHVTIPAPAGSSESAAPWRKAS
jgi:hypothetical protein